MKLVHAIAALVGSATVSIAAAQTQITIQYPYAYAFKPIFDTLVERFEKVHPDVRVVTRPPYQNYEDGIEKTLRGAISNDLPDISIHAINRQRVLVERGFVQPLGKLIRAESNWESRGYASGLMAIGRVAGDTYSLPFAVSTPVVYYNADLVRQVGGDPNRFPQDWDGLLALASKINALGNDISGVSFAWDITGNWMWQALVMSQGGSMLTPDEKKVASGGPAGQHSMRLLSRMVKEGGMRNLNVAAGRQSFAAGKIGILISTSAYTETLDKAVGGRFPVRTTTFPLPAEKGKLPGGGSVVVMSAKKPDTQKAAWEFVKFITSADSAAYVASHTGYAPANALAASDPKYLGDFYKSKPNHLANMRQLDVVTQWYGFPGDNGLKITDVIADHLQSVVNGAAKPDDALKMMVEDVQRLLPR